jgi:NAD(P)-dependent dehydrogenase (short-subunit alcohol dehydrogenase family)
MNQRFLNKNIVVTGAASGLGLAMAKRFAQEGGQVFLLDKNENQLAAAHQNLADEGLNVKSLPLDVKDAEAIKQTFKRVSHYFSGTIDVLVNNAGILNFNDAENCELAVWNQVMTVNVTGVFLCSKYALPSMKAHGGSIVNIASITGMVGVPKMLAYCTSKAAVIGMTKQMAVDYASQGIRVNCVCPGTVANTQMGQQISEYDNSEEAKQKRLAKYPIGRFATAEEIAAAVLFLASDEASFVCGSAFTVDGGMTAI